MSTDPDPTAEPTDAEMAEAEANLQAAIDSYCDSLRTRHENLFAAEHQFELSKVRFVSHIDGMAGGASIALACAYFLHRFPWWPWMALAMQSLCAVAWIAVWWVRRPK